MTPPNEATARLRETLKDAAEYRTWIAEDQCVVSRDDLTALLDQRAGDVPYTGAPPPHWINDKNGATGTPGRYPATAAEWDYRNDPSGAERKELMTRRLRFAYVLADPRAPDQMALVHRKDLGWAMEAIIRLGALLERQAPTASSPIGNGGAEAINDEVMPDRIWLVDRGSGDIEWSAQEDWEDDPVGQVAYVRAALRTPAASSADAGLVEAARQLDAGMRLCDGQIGGVGAIRLNERDWSNMRRLVDAALAAHRAQEPQS